MTSSVSTAVKFPSVIPQNGNPQVPVLSLASTHSTQNGTCHEREESIVLSGTITVNILCELAQSPVLFM